MNRQQEIHAQLGRKTSVLLVRWLAIGVLTFAAMGGAIGAGADNYAPPVTPEVTLGGQASPTVAQQDVVPTNEWVAGVKKPTTRLELLQNIKYLLDKKLLLKEDFYAPENFELWFGGAEGQWKWVKLAPVQRSECFKDPTPCGHFVNWAALEELYQESNKLIKSFVEGSGSIGNVDYILRSTFYRKKGQIVSLKLGMRDDSNLVVADITRIFLGDWKSVSIKETGFPMNKWEGKKAMRREIRVGEHTERIDMLLEADRVLQVEALLRR
jgi:hypothetical protein